ncbi:glycosyltransferase [Aquabacterium sp. J223]|nr:glycosyltransferase [Aquabacterium sp. J223]
MQDTLERLGRHPEFMDPRIEVVISDNASTDATSAVVTSFADRTGKAIRFRRNPTNQGIDGNIHAVSRLATGRYLLLMSDDDLLLPGALGHLLKMVDDTPSLLFCFVNGGSFTGRYDPAATLPPLVPLQAPLYTDDPNELLTTIGVWSTFISSFFVERQAWLNVPNAEAFIGSDIYLTHVLFRLLARERPRPSSVTATQWLAARAEYTGSFRVFHAFGHSLLKLLTHDAPAIGLDPAAMRRIKLQIIRRALPPMVLMVRSLEGRPRALVAPELLSLLRYTWREPLAWVFLLPVALLPLPVLQRLMRFKRKLLKRSVFA